MKYGIKLKGEHDLSGTWVQSFSEYTTEGGKTKPLTFGSYAEAEAQAHDAGWKNYSIEVIND